MKNNYDGGICDPNKAVTCSKKKCYYITKNKNHCMNTTNPMWLKENNYDKSK